MRKQTAISMSKYERILAFMHKVKKDHYGCWLWQGAIVQSLGYGRFGMGGRLVEYAHRASWMLLRGEIPKGMYVCHHCDVRACVNPEHLFIGTAEDNMRDCANKGRIRIPFESHRSNQQHQLAILTDDMVREIRAWTGRTIDLYRSKKWPVGYEAVCSARSGKTFQEVV